MKLADLIYELERNADHSKEYTPGQFANIIGKAMVNFFEDSGTSY
jgi:hypothetical protein